MMLWLTLFFLIPHQSFQQSKCELKNQKISYHDCDVSYEACDDATIKFHSCLSIYCNAYDKGTCIDNKTNQFTETQCFQLCCPLGSTSGYEFNAQNLQICKLESQKIDIIQIGVLGAICGVLLLTGILTYLFLRFELCGIFCHFVTCRCFTKSLDDQSNNENQNITEENLKKTSLHLWQNDDSLQGKEILGPYVSCTICLSVDVDCIIKCGHPFHFKCIGQYIKKKLQCPNCCTSDIDPMKIYCKSCFRSYIQYSSNESIHIISLIERRNNAKCQMCQWQ